MATYPGTVESGAIALSSAYQSVLGMGGYAYAYGDSTSSACSDSSYLCIEGTTGAPSSSTVYGAGIGVNLNQAVGASAKGTIVVPSGDTGISYALEGIVPAGGFVVIIDAGGTDYCATVTALSGTVLWSSFFTCIAPSTQLAGAPDAASHVQIEVPAGASAKSFNFCVTALSFAKTGGGGNAGGTCSIPTESSACNSGYISCDGVGDCCPPATPYGCVSLLECYATQAEANAACGSACITCGG